MNATRAAVFLVLVLAINEALVPSMVRLLANSYMAISSFVIPWAVISTAEMLIFEQVSSDIRSAREIDELADVVVYTSCSDGIGLNTVKSDFYHPYKQPFSTGIISVALCPDGTESFVHASFGLYLISKNPFQNTQGRRTVTGI